MGPDGCPTPLSIQENAWGLARYARACQESGLVPIVEPEILMDGDHNIDTTAAVQERVIAAVYKACNDNGVYLEGSLLKPSMTVPGVECQAKSSPEEVAKYTIQTLERVVPASVPGITFLSGGLSEEDASIFLNTINQQERVGPWSMTFSYSRRTSSSRAPRPTRRPTSASTSRAASRATRSRSTSRTTSTEALNHTLTGPRWQSPGGEVELIVERGERMLNLLCS